MRKLKTSDVPVLCRSLKKLGLKERFYALAQDANNAQDVWDRGFDVLWSMFDAATEGTGEVALYEFLAGPFEMTAEQVRDLDLDILLENLQQMAAENNLAAFFKSAARLMK